MNLNKPASHAQKAKAISVKDPDNLTGTMKRVGGSQSDHWNETLANQALRTLWTAHSNDETQKRQYQGMVAALVSIEPRDELEAMIAAQLFGAHNAAMECYRRAMLKDQTFEGYREYLNQANKLSRTYSVLLDALNRHRGKGQQKVTVEHVHVHSGGQAIVGTIESPAVELLETSGTTQCERSWPCTSARDAEPELEAGTRAKRQRCRTAVAGCTAECRREHRRAIRMPSNTDAIRQRRSHDDERFQSWCAQ